MFEVLMFLFENYMEGSAKLTGESEAIIRELERVGFERYEIDRALTWLNGLQEFQEAVQANPINVNAIRHYLPEEAERLQIEGQGFLLYLERINILDPVTREIVIDRIMALDPREVHMGRIRWVILMVLFNQPDKKSAMLLLQDLVLSDAFNVKH